MSRPPRFGLVKHRVGETLDVEELRRFAAQGFTLNRAAEFLGVHWTTTARAARAHGIEFPRAYGPRYGWQGISRIRQHPQCHAPLPAALYCARRLGHAGAHQARLLTRPVNR